MKAISYTVVLRNVDETQAWAGQLARQLKPEDVVALIGPLGAGKTTFVVGLAKGLKCDPQVRVSSPTFVYSHIYPGTIPLYHLDLYRIENEMHLRETGLHEMVGGDGVAVIEWFDRFPTLWDSDRVELRFSIQSGDVRKIEIQGFGERGIELLSRMKDLL